MRRWRIGANGRFREEGLDGLDVQFPRIDDRVQGKRYATAFVNGTSRPSAGRVDGYDAIAAVHVEAGRRDQWDAGDGMYLGEPVFAPKPGGGIDEGWLLALRWDSKRNESALVVLDAKHVADGPVATVWMPARVPGGFHCSWAPAA
jgi:carotenoid cleavage dioxygenase